MARTICSIFLIPRLYNMASYGQLSRFKRLLYPSQGLSNGFDPGSYGLHWPGPHLWRQHFWRHPHEPPAPPLTVKSLSPDLRHCGWRISPECIKALYNLPVPAEVASYDNNTIDSLGVLARPIGRIWIRFSRSLRLMYQMELNQVVPLSTM